MDEATYELREGSPEQISDVDKNSCKYQVLIIFEDICPRYLEQVAQGQAFNSDAVVAAILDQQERGIQYPRRENPKKRKRDEDGDERPEGEEKAIKARINDPAYGLRMYTMQYLKMATRLISQDFPKVPINIIKDRLEENGSSVFRTYAAIDDALRAWNDDNPAWQNKKSATKVLDQYMPGNIANMDLEDFTAQQLAALDEFRAARVVRNGKDAEKATKIEELKNVERARISGELSECGCCFDEFPLNRMVHCEGEDVHWFCRNCMKRQVETTIGYSKFELTCLSMDGCSAGFSVSQRRAFIDKKLQIALDRIEQQAMLRLAGIENLETCPFCPFAMEYPPVEENKEFRCANPECETVSCRLCRKNTHIPKTCAEAAIEEGHSARHTIEEAMSEAVIRKCNKCANPFIKQDGCNKITCTRCHTIQCYVCRETVRDYSHFNDVNRGGKHGQCPLFDATEERHQNEVQRAEEQTRSKVAKENPELNAEVLQFKISAKVLEDESRRKQQDPPILARGQMRRFWPEVPPQLPPEIPGPNRAVEHMERQAAARQQLYEARLGQIDANICRFGARCRVHGAGVQQQQERQQQQEEQQQQQPPGIRPPHLPPRQRIDPRIPFAIAKKIARDGANAEKHHLQQQQARKAHIQVSNPPPILRLANAFPVAQMPQPVRMQPQPRLNANRPIMLDQPEAGRLQEAQMPLNLDALFFPPMVDRDLDMFLGIGGLQPLQNMLGNVPVQQPNHRLINNEKAIVNRVHEQMLREMRLGSGPSKNQDPGPVGRYGLPVAPASRVRDRPVVPIQQLDDVMDATMATATADRLRTRMQEQPTPVTRTRGARA